MPRTDYKRQLVTWKCESCGRDLANDPHIMVDCTRTFPQARCCCTGCALDTTGEGVGTSTPRKPH